MSYNIIGNLRVHYGILLIYKVASICFHWYIIPGSLISRLRCESLGVSITVVTKMM